MTTPRARRLTYVVSSHGFGHAARACAVIEALLEQVEALHVTVVGDVPPWFLHDSLGPRLPHRHMPLPTDVGLAQRTALDEDLSTTVDRLAEWIAIDGAAPPRLRDDTLEPLVEAVAGCDLVVADISPFGLAAARQAGVPSVLVENFTWDWIYRGYGDLEPRLTDLAQPLAEVFAGVDHHLQTEPFCQAAPGAVAVPPVARRPRRDRAEIRRQLEIPDDAPMALVTMGGIEWDYDHLEDRLSDPSLPWLVIPGSCTAPRRHGRCWRLPHRSEHYHPDLVHAADAVVGKLGYSTLAEVWSAGIPYGFVPRAHFPESPPLADWVQRHLPHKEIPPQRFESGDWLDDVRELVALGPIDPPAVTGAQVAASHLASWLG